MGFKEGAKVKHRISQESGIVVKVTNPGEFARYDLSCGLGEEKILEQVPGYLLAKDNSFTVNYKYKLKDNVSPIFGEFVASFKSVEKLLNSHTDLIKQLEDFDGDIIEGEIDRGAE